MAPTLSSDIREGVVLVKNPTYLKLVSHGETFNAHMRENPLYYEVGSKVEFAVYYHGNTPAAKITRLVNQKEALKFLQDLYKDVPTYQVFKIEEIFPSVTEFARVRGLKYMGPVLINDKTRYLFQ